MFFFTMVAFIFVVGFVGKLIRFAFTMMDALTERTRKRIVDGRDDEAEYVYMDDDGNIYDYR